MVRAVGINHMALEVEDVDEALAWYGRFFALELRGRRPGMAWIDLGDQFLALSERADRPADRDRHFGLVVDGKESLRTALREADVPVSDGPGLRFHDPWGNQVEIVEYADVQFTKAPGVLKAMGLGELGKTEKALAELRAKGLDG